jgi:translation initiation factor IF-1
MPKEEGLKLGGTVVELLPNAMFRVQVDGQLQPVIGVISGRMRQYNIKISQGDRVDIEFSVYDLTRGRIVRRN